MVSKSRRTVSKYKEEVNKNQSVRKRRGMKKESINKVLGKENRTDMNGIVYY